MTRLHRRLARLEQAACLSEQSAGGPQPLPPGDEAVPLAGQLAASFAALVKSYQAVNGLSREEALAGAGETNPAYEKLILHGPPDQVQWHDLDALARRDPELARRRWEEVKQAARAELQSGHRAAAALETVPTCWERARFLAVRDDLAGALGPQSGLEWQLIGTMAQAQTMWLAWLEALAARTALAGRGCKRALEGRDRYEPPRLSDAEATAEAAAMVERWHRLFLSTLRALQDGRRVRPPVVIRRAGQVNVAQQQVNLGGS